MILAPEGFRDEEYEVPKKAFEASGIEVITFTKGGVSAKGMMGAVVVGNAPLNSEFPTDAVDAVVFVGGAGAKIYFEDETAHMIARRAVEKGKIVAAICIAPSILANAGILNGVRATSFSSETANLSAKGAIVDPAHVVVDGKIVTADGPNAAREFADTILSLLRQK